MLGEEMKKLKVLLQARFMNCKTRLKLKVLVPVVLLLVLVVGGYVLVELLFFATQKPVKHRLLLL